MDSLSIRLTGEILSSNFEDWKTDLIKQIQDTKSQLITDADFVNAANHVKLFKTAENSLKQAKQSAINQAADIQKLFTAIDEVSAEAREARLVLERQIKIRKQEIKEQLIASGIELIYDSIKQQNTDFQLINHADFIDFKRFEVIVKGKSGIKGVEIAINKLCKVINQEITQKAGEVIHNAQIIDALPSQHQILFQDRASLLALSKQELELTIEKRIALLNEKNAQIKADKAISELEKIEDTELNPDNAVDPTNQLTTDRNHYRLVINILSSKDDAIEIARSIKGEYANNSLITDIKLSRDHS